MGLKTAAKLCWGLFAFSLVCCSALTEPRLRPTFSNPSPKKGVLEEKPAVSADPWDLEMAQRPAEEVPPLPVTILRPPPVPALSEDENASSGIALASSEHEGMVWYHQGQANLEAGQFDAAVRAFSIFVQNAPDHVYADRAQYWIGESYFRNGEYALAVVADNHFLSAYPESVKVPAVLWRAALSQEKMGHLQASQTILKDLVRRFPNETESVSASQKMTELSKLSRG